MVSFPKSYSEVETAAAKAIIERSRFELSPYAGNWSASWMPNDAFAKEWGLVNGRSKCINGEWTGLTKYTWSIGFHDGTRLVDPGKEFMLESAQKTAFLIRTLKSCNISNSSALVTILHCQSAILRWMYLHGEIFCPEKYAFSRLTTASIDEFLRIFAIGGVAWVLDYPRRLVDFCSEGIGREAPSFDLKNPVLPDGFRENVIEWLHSQSMYRSGYIDASALYLDRVKLVDKLGFDLGALKTNPKLRAFFSQLEPNDSHLLLHGMNRRREFPSHKVKTVEESLLASKRNIMTMKTTFGYLFRLHRHLPNLVPDSASVDWGKICRQHRERSVGHTLWMPLEVSLAYTTESLRWVHVYGEDLVSYFLRIAKVFKDRGLFLSESELDEDEARALRADAMRDIAPPQSLKCLNISGWTRAGSERGLYHQSRRASPSLSDAIGVLVGACLVLIGMLKPSRDSEVITLCRDCVFYVKGDGYWLNSDLAKTGAEDVRQRTSKPIPTIVGKAVELIRKLSDGCRLLEGDTNIKPSDPLFLVPERGAITLSQIKPLTRARSIGYLDWFCDWVNLPIDKHGRRWYVRIHEMRKSFLITFFWCFRFGGLDAARWVAGHANASHVYAYIEANFPGDEIPSLEAQYAAKQLFAFEEDSCFCDAENTEDLYDVVRGHFRVASVDLIAEAELVAWLTEQFRGGSISIEPFSVREEGQVSGVRICYRLGTCDDRT